MSKNIVVLSGSPRKGGNTDTLAAAFIEGAQTAGKNVTLFRVADMKIGGCLGCEGCEQKGVVCVQKDSMLEIFDALQNADALVLASPVYYFSVSAQLKLAIDRIYALRRICKNNGVKIPIKKAALLMPCADETIDTASGAIEMLKHMCAYYKWENGGAIIATGLHKPGDIDGRAELEEARELGRSI